MDYIQPQLKCRPPIDIVAQWEVVNQTPQWSSQVLGSGIYFFAQRAVSLRAFRSGSSGSNVHDAVWTWLPMIGAGEYIDSAARDR